MSDKIYNKLITLSVDELDNYIEFLESIYSPTITGKEIDKKTMEYLGITDWFFTASRFPVRRHVHGVQAVFGILPDAPCKVNIISQSINALFYP